MPELTNRRKRAVYDMFETVDHIVAVCDWMKQVLVANGVPPAKITVCRQGLPFPGAERRRGLGDSSSPLRVVFVGRLAAIKGVLELAEAVVASPAAINLDIYGIAQGDEGARIREKLADICTRDARIRLLPPVPAQQVVSTLAKYDVLAVPSRSLETGPLVVYEAFAAGLPVAGSNLGGISELVQEGVNGLLIPYDSKQAWTRALTLLAGDRALLERLRSGLPRPRTMADAAADMMPVYERLFRPVGVPAASLA